VTRVYELLTAPWYQGNEQFHQLMDVLELCRDGIARTPHVARYAEAWDEFCVELKINQGDKASLEYLQTLAAKATAELTLGFPTIHSHVTVSLWSIVDDDVRKDMLELSEMRNVIVHRGSLADRKLLQACPWLPLKPKDKIVIDHATCNRYVKAVDNYMGNTMTRAGRKIIEFKKLDPQST
jgi:hypothetical protein